MPCNKCESERQTEFSAELNVHFPGRKGRNSPAVLLYPKLLVCLNCGFTEFTIPKNELPRLARDVGKQDRVS